MNGIQSDFEEPPGLERQPLPGTRVSSQANYGLSSAPQTGPAQLFRPYISGALRRPPRRPNDVCANLSISSAFSVTVSGGCLKLP